MVHQFVIVTLTVRVPHGVENESVKLPRVLFNELTANALLTPFVTLRLLGPLVNVTVLLGTPVKLIVPLPFFGNDNGLGLVVTAMLHGVGETDGLGDGLPAGDGDGLASGDCVGVGLAPGDGLSVGVASGEGLSLGEASGVGCAVGVGDGFGLLLPLIVEPESRPVIPLTFTFTFGTSSR